MEKIDNALKIPLIYQIKEVGRGLCPPMAPAPFSYYASSSQHKNLRSGQEELRTALSMRIRHRTASFHGRTSPPEHRQLRRPETQPELLSPADERRVPEKLLVNVTVQRSLGHLQVVAPTDWTVGDLVAAALRRYVGEGRRPLVPADVPSSAFTLHYSQFSLEREQLNQIKTFPKLEK